MIDNLSVKPIRILFLIAMTFCLSAVGRSNEFEKIEQWGVYELSLEGPSTGNPYQDAAFSAEFKYDSRTITVPGFYDGEGVYRIRFSPGRLGKWSYVTQSNRPGLGGRSGVFECTRPTGENHGPLKIVNTYYLEDVRPGAFRYTTENKYEAVYLAVRK